MLVRSLGAGTLAGFWRYWNPIWGYYLSKYIHAPLRHWLPSGVSIVITFIVSGALHDLAASAVKGQAVFFITPWFFLMGLGVVTGQAMRLDYSRFNWPVRAIINICYVGMSLATTYAIKA